MKTGMELVEEWRKDADFLWSAGLPADAKRIQERADLLQAWLREADEWAATQQAMSNATDKRFSSWGTVNEVWTNAWMITRQYLLGTTSQKK